MAEFTKDLKDFKETSESNKSDKSNHFVTIGLLLDYYESVLSEKQFRALDMYYNQDMSLSEIGEDLNITRQGVYELLKRGEEKLLALEEKLHCHQLTVACNGLRKALVKVTALQNEKRTDEAIRIASRALEEFESFQDNSTDD